jgi:hypothetical protein
MARDIHMQARARGFMIVLVVSSTVSAAPPVVDNARAVEVARFETVRCKFKLVKIPSCDGKMLPDIKAEGDVVSIHSVSTVTVNDVESVE